MSIERGGGGGMIHSLIYLFIIIIISGRGGKSQKYFQNVNTIKEI